MAYDDPAAASSPLAPFRWPDFRRLFVSTACSTLASRAVAVVLGYEIYDLTDSPLALGFLGLVEAIPAVAMSLYAGHVADRRERGRILRSTMFQLLLGALALSALEVIHSPTPKLAAIYMVVFLSGIARGFADPAAQALEAQVVPRHMLIHSSTVMAACWTTAAVLGPLAGGMLYAVAGAAVTYLAIGGLYALSWIAALRLTPQPIPQQPPGESVWQSVATGVRYVVGDQVLLGSMALDLFAVFFGGAIAMLPVFARDILHVGPIGLGVLNAAPTTGALLTMLLAARFPPVRHAGRNLFVAVTGFGVAMIVFALSRSFYLSIAALALSGVCDGVSVVIRRAILRVLSPDHLRGRIAAVGSIFIRSSNEFGAFESGMAAALLGTVTSVWAGGVATLAVVAAAFVMAPKLRCLSLDPATSGGAKAVVAAFCEDATEEPNS